MSHDFYWANGYAVIKLIVVWCLFICPCLSVCLLFPFLFSPQGRQEDAEEFLGCMLDGLHEEIVSAKKAMEESNSEDKGLWL